MIDEVTVKAYANIALVKYWGKQPGEGNMPAVGSISIGLDDLYSQTRVKQIHSTEHLIHIDGKGEGAAIEKARKFLKMFGELHGTGHFYEVWSENNFPTGAGLASSASGFAALTLAIAHLESVDASLEQLSATARQGSGSAARSIYGGYVEMSATSGVARPLCAAEDWPLDVIIAITATSAKKVGSTEGMVHTADTSPFYNDWVASHSKDMDAARKAIQSRDFEALARVSEHSCLKMHAVMMSANPGLIYWNPASLALIQRIRELQSEGLQLFFTIDAGPQVKVVCNQGDSASIRQALSEVPGVLDIRTSRVGGAPEIEVRSAL